MTNAQPMMAVVNVNPSAEIALARGDLAAARRLADEAVETATGFFVALALTTRAHVAIARDEHERAERDLYEALAHNTAELRCGRMMIDKFPEIVTQLAGIAERFATALDCVDTGFLADGVLDQLPAGSDARPNRRSYRDSTNCAGSGLLL